MRRATRRRPQFETLEVKALLSGTTALPAVTTTGPAQVGQAATGGAALPEADVQALQQVASGGNLELFMSQVAALVDPRSAVRQYAMGVVADHQMSDLQFDDLARTKRVIVPSGLAGGDQALGHQFVAAINRPNFDQTYLALMVQVNTRDLSLERQLASSSQDADVQRNAQAAITEDQAHLSGAQALLTGTTAGGTPGSGGSGTPGQGSGGTTLIASDVQYLQSSSSTNALELVISTLASLSSQKASVRSYADKLVSDHRQSLVQAQGLAQAYGVNLQPGIATASDLQAARKVLKAVNTAGFDRTYLSTNVQVHENDLSENRREISTTPSSNLKQFAQDDIPTDQLHLMGAQTLLKSIGGKKGGKKGGGGTGSTGGSTGGGSSNFGLGTGGSGSGNISSGALLRFLGQSQGRSGGF